MPEIIPSICISDNSPTKYIFDNDVKWNVKTPDNKKAKYNTISQV